MLCNHSKLTTCLPLWLDYAFIRVISKHNRSENVTGVIDLWADKSHQISPDNKSRGLINQSVTQS